MMNTATKTEMNAKTSSRLLQYLLVDAGRSGDLQCRPAVLAAQQQLLRRVRRERDESRAGKGRPAAEPHDAGDVPWQRLAGDNDPDSGAHRDGELLGALLVDDDVI